MPSLCDQTFKTLFDTNGIIQKRDDEITDTAKQRQEIGVFRSECESKDVRHFRNACKNGDEQGTDPESKRQNQTEYDHLGNGAVADFFDFCRRTRNFRVIQVHAGCKENLRHREKQRNDGAKDCFCLRECRCYRQDDYADDNGKGADDCAEKYFRKQEFGCADGEHFGFQCRQAVTRNVRCAEGVGQNTEDEQYQKRQREGDLHTDCIDDQRFEQGIAGVHHNGHCRSDREVREEVLRIAEYGDKFLTQKRSQTEMRTIGSFNLTRFAFGFILEHCRVEKSFRYKVYEHDRKQSQRQNDQKGLG